MVVVDGQQAGEHRIETEQEQAAGGSRRTGEQAGAAGGRGWGKRRSSQPGGVRGSWRPRPVAPSGTTKQNKTRILAFFILKYNSKILIKALVNEFPHLITLHI